MANRELSFSLGIGTSPLYDNPEDQELNAELLRVYQAVNTLALQLDSATNGITAAASDRGYILASAASKEAQISRIYCQCGVAITAGELLHVGANYVVNKAQSNVTHNLKAQAIALQSGSAGAWIPVALRGVCRLFVGLTAGQDYFLSTTAGAITSLLPGTGNTVQYIGFALSTGELYFNPEIRHSVA